MTKKLLSALIASLFTAAPAFGQSADDPMRVQGTGGRKNKSQLVFSALVTQTGQKHNAAAPGRRCRFSSDRPYGAAARNATSKLLLQSIKRFLKLGYEGRFALLQPLTAHCAPQKVRSWPPFSVINR